MIIQPMHSLSPSSYSNPWVTRLVTLLLAAIVAASAGYWVLRWPAPSSPLGVNTLAPTAARQVDTRKVAQLLGASRFAATAGDATSTISLASNYKLLGVIAVGQHNGSALISANSKLAKPYRVGEHVSDDLVLLAVNARSVTLAPNLKEPAVVTLELPLTPGMNSTP